MTFKYPFLSTSIVARGIATAMLATQSAAVTAAWALPSTPQEQDALRIANALKPISDEEWQSIAGEKSAEEYLITAGDTLYDISSRLFGDAKYWPKIWALNNGRIMNPHLIYPGNRVAFYPGSGGSLPSVAINPTEASARGATYAQAGGTDVVNDAAAAGRSMEWKQLPRQPWETVNLVIPAEVDPLGFDRRNKVSFRASTGFELLAYASAAKIPPVGKVVGGRLPATLLSITDTVYIERGEGDLQVGEVYTLTQEPNVLKSSETASSSYSYLNMGQVKIIGTRENMFIGSIVSASFPVERGALLIPRINRVNEPRIIPGPSPVRGNLIVDRNVASTYTTAQHKFAFVDRGTRDGVQPGMIFRAYQHDDPNTQRKVSDSDFVVSADYLVVQVTEDMSAVICMSSYNIVDEGADVVLLTQIEGLTGPSFDDASLSTRSGGAQTGAPTAPEDQIDALDRLDPGGGMTTDEEKELQQLEEWQDDSALPEAEPGQAPESTPPLETAEPPADAAPPAAEGTEEIAPPADGAAESLDSDLGDDLTDDLFDESSGATPEAPPF